MTSRVEKMRRLGRMDALELRAEAVNLTGTEIISREESAPNFDPTKDYSSWPVGSPVKDDNQVWLLIQPHNAAHYTERPKDLRALWGLAHTTDYTMAKAWVDPHGTSGMYMTNECYRDENGVVWRAKGDNTIRDAVEYPLGWERV